MLHTIRYFIIEVLTDLYIDIDKFIGDTIDGEPNTLFSACTMKEIILNQNKNKYNSIHFSIHLLIIYVQHI